MVQSKHELRKAHIELALPDLATRTIARYYFRDCNPDSFAGKQNMNSLTSTVWCRVNKVALASVLAASLAWPAPKAAAQVTVSGSFSSYTGGASATATINGVALSGTSVTEFKFSPSAQVDFVDGFNNANQLKFISSGVQQVAAVGDEFLLGRILYTNGDWSLGAASFHVRFTTSSPVAAFDGHVFDDAFSMFVTPNSRVQTPLQNADFVYFASRPDLGSIRVFEAFDSPGNNTGSVSFYGRIGSLIPSRFADPVGGATIVPSVAAILAPEPSALALTASGLMVLMLAVRRRRRAQNLA